MHHHLHTLPLAIDALSLGVIIAYWAGIVGPLATTASLAWTVYCFVKEYINYKKKKK